MSRTQAEASAEKMDCPNCGQKNLGREEADVGIGIMYGPFGCGCGWSEWPEYNQLTGEAVERSDQWGLIDPIGRA